MGDDKKGDRSMLSASRTAGVMTAGAAGFVVGGPVGAVTAGMTTGSVFDVGHSVITDKPQGTVRAAGEFVENPSARTLYDAFAAPVSDGILGYQGGNIVASAQELFSLEEAPNTAVQEGGGYCAQAKAKFNGAYKIYKKVDAKKTLDEAMFPTRVSMEKYGNSKEEEQEK